MLPTLKLALDRTVTLANLAEKLRDAYADRPALLPDLRQDAEPPPEPDEAITYSQASRVGNRLANYLITRYDLKKGQRVLLRLEDQRACFLFLLGAVKAGGLAVIAAPTLAPEALREACENSRPHVTVTETPLGYPAGAQLLPEEMSAGLAEADTFFIPYTLKRVDAVAVSYSQGQPSRGVMSANANLTGPQRALAALLAFLLRDARARGARARAAISVPLARPEGLAAWTTALLAGYATQAVQGSSAAGAEVFLASPERFQALAAAGRTWSDFPGLRLCVSWGGFLDAATARAFSGGPAPLLECYGLPEAPPPLLVSLTRAGHPAGSRISAWALPPQRVVSGDGRLVSRGPNLAPGIWMDMEATAELLQRRELVLPLTGRATAGHVSLSRS